MRSNYTVEMRQSVQSPGRPQIRPVRRESAGRRVGRRTRPFRPGPPGRRRPSARPRPTPWPPRRRRRSEGPGGPGARRRRRGRRSGGSPGPRRPRRPLPSAGRSVDGSNTIPSMVLIRVTASAPESATAEATSTRRSVLALNLAHRGRPHPAVAAITAAEAVGVVGEDAAAPLEVRARQVDLDRHNPGRSSGEQVGGGRELGHRSAPDAAHHGRLGAQELRQVVIEPRWDTWALQSDGIDHPQRRGVHPRGGIAGPLEGGDRLGRRPLRSRPGRSRRRTRRRTRRCPRRS